MWCQYIFCIDLLHFVRYSLFMSKPELESLHIRVSAKTAERLRVAVEKCGRGMSQGLFLERCFEIASEAVIKERKPSR